MAVANTKSTAITNADASPRVPNTGFFDGGGMQYAVGTVEVAAADDNNSVYRFARIPSGVRVHKIEILNDAITAGTDYNLGLHAPATDGGAAVDDNLWGDAIDMSSARIVPLDATFEALDIANIEKRVWEALGLSEDPFLEYDVTLTGITVGSAAGTISVRVAYAV